MTATALHNRLLDLVARMRAELASLSARIDEISRPAVAPSPSPSGSAAYSVVTQTADYTATITSGEIVILADNPSGLVITLPSAVGNSATINVKKLQAAGLVTVSGAIDGGSSAVLNGQNEAITLKSNGSTWDIF